MILSSFRDGIDRDQKTSEVSLKLPLLTCPPLWHLHVEPCATGQAGTPPG